MKVIWKLSARIQSYVIMSTTKPFKKEDPYSG